MQRLTVWVAYPHEYDIEDTDFNNILEAMKNEDVDAIGDFLIGMDQTFGAGFYGSAEITGIYTDDGCPLGVG